MTKEELKKTRQYKNISTYNKANLSVPRSWCLRFDLTPTELMIFEEIHLYTHYFQRRAFFGSRTQFAVITNGSLPQVDRSLQHLAKKGFIEKDEVEFKTAQGTMRKQISYRSLLPMSVLPSDKNIEEILETNIVRLQAIGKID